MPQTPPPPNADVLRTIQAVLFDCDWVLTPGDLPYDANGVRTLRFHARDGLGIALLERHNIKTGIISGRPTDLAELRHRELGMSVFIGSCRAKHGGVLQACESLGVKAEHCAFVGDDIPDLAAFSAVGLGIAVADAADEVHEAADWVLASAGGHGAAREVAEHLLKAQGHWQNLIDTSKNRS